jgi:hypothetical protein
MESDREFHDAEPGAQMPARDGDCINRLGTEFVRHLSQLLRVETAQVGRALKGIE